MTTSSAPNAMSIEPSKLASICFRLDVSVRVARRMLKRFNPRAPKAFLRYDSDEEKRFGLGFFALDQKTREELVLAVGD